MNNNFELWDVSNSMLYSYVYIFVYVCMYVGMFVFFSVSCCLCTFECVLVFVSIEMKASRLFLLIEQAKMLQFKTKLGKYITIYFVKFYYAGGLFHYK